MSDVRIRTSLIKRVCASILTGSGGHDPTCRKMLHSPGMTNWKGKLCSPGDRTPVETDRPSAERFRTNECSSQQTVKLSQKMEFLQQTGKRRKAEWNWPPFLRYASFTSWLQLQEEMKQSVDAMQVWRSEQMQPLLKSAGLFERLQTNKP